MPNRVHLLVESQPFTVEVRADSLVIDNDVAAAVRVTPLGAGRFRLDGPDGPFDAIAAVSGDRIWIAVEGETFECRLIPQPLPRAASDADERLTSPMPATVAAIPVGVGQSVDAGDVLIALEAMKMELPLRAPRRGVVSALHCHVGDLVQPDVVLVELAAERLGVS